MALVKGSNGCCGAELDGQRALLEWGVLCVLGVVETLDYFGFHNLFVEDFRDDSVRFDSDGRESDDNRADLVCVLDDGPVFALADGLVVQLFLILAFAPVRFLFVDAADTDHR